MFRICVMCLSRKDFRKLLFGLNLRFKVCCLRVERYPTYTDASLEALRVKWIPLLKSANDISAES